MASDPHVHSVENKINRLLESGFGEKHGVKTRIADIDVIPFDDFDDLQHKVKTGQAVMRQVSMSTSGTMFRLMAKPREKLLFSIFLYLGFLVPLAGLVLAYVYTWWFAILLITPILFIKLGKDLYTRSVFACALESELVFSFLFCGGFITLQTSDGQVISHQDSE